MGRLGHLHRTARRSPAGIAAIFEPLSGGAGPTCPWGRGTCPASPAVVAATPPDAPLAGAAEGMNDGPSRPGRPLEGGCTPAIPHGSADMLRRSLCFALPLACLCAFAEGADDSDADRLAASATKWQAAKKVCDGTYSYQVVVASFAGHISETTIVVRDNRVVSRRFSSTLRQPDRLPSPKVDWEETGEDIGTHEGAAAPLTLDGLYEEARRIAAADVPEHHIRDLGFDEQGLLKYCFLRDGRIADDAPLIGVRPILLMLGGE